jgi:FAD binding domain
MQGTASVPLTARELSEAMRHGFSYDASRLDRVLRNEDGMIEVQAGTTWKSLALQVRPGDERAANARTNVRTVGESIARNGPGPDGRPTVDHVESLTLVTPGGELRQIKRSANGELFALVVGGQGVFGALYSVTLRLGSMLQAIGEAKPIESLTLDKTSEATRPLQLLVPPEKLAGFVDQARERCGEWRTAIERAEVTRTLPEGETVLRWAPREYALVTLMLAQRGTIGTAVRATQLRRSLIDSAIDCGGSFPIDCTPEATREQAETCYPQLKTVLAEKKRFDPEGKLSNAWYRHYASLLGRESCQSRWNN